MLLILIAALIAPPAAGSMPASSTPVIAPPPLPCPLVAPLPVALSAWRSAQPLAGGLVVGRAANLPAVPVANVRLAVRPSKPLSGTHLATAGFEVKAAGTYTVAVGGAAAPVRPLWLDLAGADGTPLTSAAHTHGPACTSITKTVDFKLVPGRYTFLATGLTSAAPVRVLIVRKS